MKYGVQVMNIVNAAIEEGRIVDQKERELKTKYDREEITGKTYQAEREQMEHTRNTIREKAFQQLHDVAEAHSAAVAKWNDYSGDQITEDAKLFDLPLAFGEERLQRLAEKHKDNPLMVALISQRAEKEGVNVNGLASAEVRRENFKTYVERAARAIDDPASMSTAFFLEGQGVPETVNADY